MATKTVTAVGNAQLDTAQYFLGVSSGLFDGTGDYLTVPDNADFAFGADPFTVQWRIRFNTLPTDGNAIRVFSQQTDANHRWQILVRNITNKYYLEIYIWDSPTYLIDFQEEITVAINTWYHLEMCRSGNNWYFFLDGTQVGVTETDADAFGDMTGSLYVCSDSAGTNTVNGWIDELEVAKGIARHTTNFVSPTTPLIADAYTVLLLHFDGPDASTTFYDDSVANSGSVSPTSTVSSLDYTLSLMAGGSATSTSTVSAPDYSISGDISASGETTSTSVVSTLDYLLDSMANINKIVPVKGTVFNRTLRYVQ